MPKIHSWGHIPAIIFTSTGLVLIFYSLGFLPALGSLLVAIGIAKIYTYIPR